MDENGQGTDGTARRLPTGLLALVALGLVTGIAMGLLTAFGPQRAPGVGGQGGLPTPVPDRSAAGSSAPDFTAQTADGETIVLSDLRGRPVALNFWATWCAPCRVEMPELQSASERYAEDGLVILAVNAGESAETVRGFMDELGLTFPAVLDPDGEIVSLYGVRVFPTTIWIDVEGVIRGQHFGALDESLIERYMEDVMSSAETTSTPNSSEWP